MENELVKIKILNQVDYSGKLNKHQDYLKMLNILEEKCNYIGITYDHELVKMFEKDIIQTTNTNEWWGIETSITATVTFIKTSKELFAQLKKYETFCKYEDTQYLFDDPVKLTEYGISDIAFYNNQNNILLRTNTHEGFIDVTEQIDKEFNNK